MRYLQEVSEGFKKLSELCQRVAWDQRFPRVSWGAQKRCMSPHEDSRVSRTFRMKVSGGHRETQWVSGVNGGFWGFHGSFKDVSEVTEIFRWFHI